MVPARTLKFLLVSFACVAVLAACARTSSGPTPEELAERARREAKEFANTQYLWRAKRIIDLVDCAPVRLPPALNERQLKVTLMLNVVKLLAPK